MSNELPESSILELWPVIREDFMAFTEDPTFWFVEKFEKATIDRDWESVDRLIEIFKLVNRVPEGHGH